MFNRLFQGKFSTKSDVWSFAVTLWEILTFAREQPFEMLSDEQIIENCGHYYRHDNQEVCPAQPSNCPKEIFDLMCECWNRDEQQRPTFNEIHMFLQRKNMGYSPREDMQMSAVAPYWVQMYLTLARHMNIGNVTCWDYQRHILLPCKNTCYICKLANVECRQMWIDSGKCHLRGFRLARQDSGLSPCNDLLSSFKIVFPVVLKVAVSKVTNVLETDVWNASDAIPVTALAGGRIAIESSTHHFLGWWCLVTMVMMQVAMSKVSLCTLTARRQTVFNLVPISITELTLLILWLPTQKGAVIPPPELCISALQMLARTESFWKCYWEG